MQTALDEGRQAGVEAVRQDPAANDAARKAVDETELCPISLYEEIGVS
jgi:hypothetical protein